MPGLRMRSIITFKDRSSNRPQPAFSDSVYEKLASADCRFFERQHLSTAFHAVAFFEIELGVAQSRWLGMFIAHHVCRFGIG